MTAEAEVAVTLYPESGSREVNACALAPPGPPVHGVTHTQGQGRAFPSQLILCGSTLIDMSRGASPQGSEDWLVLQEKTCSSHGVCVQIHIYLLCACEFDTGSSSIALLMFEVGSLTELTTDQ